MNKEKSSVERLFNFNPLEKEDLLPLINIIENLNKTISNQQKHINDLKNSLDIANKKISDMSQSIYVMSNHISSIINGGSVTPLTPRFNNIVENRNIGHISNGFNPMDVPNIQTQGGSVQPIDQNQTRFLQQQNKRI